MLRYLIARCHPLVARPDRAAAVSLRPHRSPGGGWYSPGRCRQPAARTSPSAPCQADEY